MHAYMQRTVTPTFNLQFNCIMDTGTVLSSSCTLHTSPEEGMLALARTPTLREQPYQLRSEVPLASNLSSHMFESRFSGY